MAEPRDQRPAAAGRSHLRASHADRDQVIEALKAAYVAGMLAKDELDARVGQALASRTCTDLAALTADLPTGLTPAMPPAPARAPGGQPARPGRWIAAATAAYAGAWVYELFLSPHGGDNPSFPLLIVGGFLVYLGILIVSVGAIIVNRQDKRSGRQPPRRPSASGPASPRGPSAGRDRHLPPTRDDPRHIAEAAPSRRRHTPLPRWRAQVSMPGVR